MFGKRKVAALVAEYLGTGVLTLVFLSVERSTIGVPYFVAIAAGLVAAMAFSAFSDVSGAQLNPAVTVALWTARKVATARALLYVVVQVLGSWTAYALYKYFVNSSLQKIGGTYSFRIFLAEAVGALVLGLGWAAVSFRNNLTVGGKAATVGISYMLAIVVAAAAGIGLVNPAVAEGVRAWDVIGSMGWLTYVLAPVVGTVVGVTLYGVLFSAEGAVADSVLLEEVVVETVSEPAVAVAPKRAPRAKAAASTRKASTRAKSTTTRRTSRSRS